jgi:hypothetical protein
VSPIQTLDKGFFFEPPLTPGQLSREKSLARTREPVILRVH